MTSPGEWYNSLPPVCRTWGTACVLTTVGVQLGVLDLRSLYLDYPLVFKRFQIWRLLTNFTFLGPFGFPFVMRMMMMCVPPAPSHDPRRASEPDPLPRLGALAHLARLRLDRNPAEDHLIRFDSIRRALPPLSAP